ncbi:MAG: glycosyltransferase family 39 protein [Clostridiaceae bacterium]
MKGKKDSIFIACLLISVFMTYLAWSIVIPFNHAPDELQRFDIVDFIIKYKTLPVAGDPRLYYGDYGITYASNPYFPYIISAAVCIIAQNLNIGIQPFIVSRIISVLSGVGTVYFCWLISKEVFKYSKAKYFFPVFLGFIPQYAFICGYTNQDSFTVFLSSIMIFLWIKGLESNWNYETAIKVGLVSGLILLSYLNGYSVVLATLFMVLISHKNIFSWKFIKKLLICIFIMFLVSGWFFIRNAYLYDGDFLGSNFNTMLSEKLAIPEFKPSARDVISKSGFGFGYLIFDTSWISLTFRSFWALFDNMSVAISYKYYLLMLSLSIASVMGLSYKVVYYFKNDFKELFKKKFFLASAFTFMCAFFLHYYYSVHSDYQPQGRYLYPALIPLLILMCKGLDEIVGDRYRGYFYKALIVIFISVNLWSLFGALYMKYYAV